MADEVSELPSVSDATVAAKVDSGIKQDATLIIGQNVVDEDAVKFSKKLMCKTLRHIRKNDLAGVSEEQKEALLTCVKFAFNDVDSSHQWIVEWRKVREILIFGEDRKSIILEKMKDYTEDEDKLIEVNAWLGEKNFGKMTQDFIDDGDAGGAGRWEKIKEANTKYIKFNVAVELFKLYVKPNDILTMSKMISRKFEPKVEYLLMIGAPAYKKTEGDANAEEVKATEAPAEGEKAAEEKTETTTEATDEKTEASEKPIDVQIDSGSVAPSLGREDQQLLSRLNEDVASDDEDKESDEETGEKELQLDEYKHALKDMNAKKRRVIDAIDRRINETLFQKKVFVDLGLTKDKLLKQIEMALQDAEAKNTTKFIIYYVGHGHADFGGWVTYVPGAGDKVVSNDVKLIHIKDILEIIKDSQYDASVEITSESCHSGNICHHAKEWMEDMTSKKKDREFKSLFVMASTYKDNRGVWGRYRKYKNLHSTEFTTPEQQAKIQRDYVRGFGTTIYDSRENYKQNYLKPKEKGKDDNLFPFPIYTAYPDDRMYKGGQKNLVDEAEFALQFWKKDQDSHPDMIKKLYKQFLIREQKKKTKDNAEEEAKTEEKTE